MCQIAVDERQEISERARKKSDWLETTATKNGLKWIGELYYATTETTTT